MEGSGDRRNKNEVEFRNSKINHKYIKWLVSKETAVLRRGRGDENEGKLATVNIFILHNLRRWLSTIIVPYTLYTDCTLTSQLSVQQTLGCLVEEVLTELVQGANHLVEKTTVPHVG